MTCKSEKLQKWKALPCKIDGKVTNDLKNAINKKSDTQ